MPAPKSANNLITHWRKPLKSNSKKTPIRDFDLVFIKTPSKSPGNERYPRNRTP